MAMRNNLEVHGLPLVYSAVDYDSIKGCLRVAFLWRQGPAQPFFVEVTDASRVGFLSAIKDAVDRELVRAVLDS